MYELTVRTRFSAAHRLRGYPGACARYHGHNWEVEVCIGGRRLNKLGLLLDFRTLKDRVREAVRDLDHTDLNEVGALCGANPSCETLARLLYERLSRSLDCREYRVEWVSVAETPEARATYGKRRIRK
ncbi:MAG: 6-carboxytetrahydropterin synthase [Kiritimatiellae bacterium]|nr:6-carboxytetrahydropterin synthase [Kiritimatiellia bacterium]